MTINYGSGSIDTDLLDLVERFADGTVIILQEGRKPLKLAGTECSGLTLKSPNTPPRSAPTSPRWRSTG